MKNSYTDDHTFVKIKEMVDVLFRLLKNNRRSFTNSIFTNGLQKQLILFQCVSHVLMEQDFNLTHCHALWEIS